MSTGRWVAVGAAIGAVVVLAIAGTGLGWWSGGAEGATPAKPLSVTTSLSPQSISFGDTTLAEVDVTFDPTVVSAGSVHYLPSFTPFDTARTAPVTRTRAGRIETIAYRYTIQCASEDCLPKPGKTLAVRLPRAQVSALEGTQQVTVKAKWQPLVIASGLQPSDAAKTKPTFRRPLTAPPPAYSVSPSLLEAVLTIGAVLLALAGLFLLGRELAGVLARRREAARRRLTPLEQALALTREAANRPDPADRRKALGLLADVLDEEGASALAETTGSIAWSEESPSADRAVKLADEIEGAVEQAGATQE